MRRDPDGKSIDLMAEGDVVRGGQSLLSGAAKSLRVYQTLSNGAAFAGLLRGEATPAAADAAWRKAGGTARITGARRDGRTLTPQQAQAANRLLAPLY
jgi:hypothetical protein